MWNMIGWLAAFVARAMVPLRTLALCSNLAFLAYGLRFGLAPVWMLHALLLPVNCCRLAQAIALATGTAAPLSRHLPRRSR